jgi:hypothetical protein
MTIAITLIAGAALFGYVNNEAAVNEKLYGQAVAGTVNFLNEQFVVVDMAVTPASHTVTLVIYNNGQEGLNITSVLLYDQQPFSSGNSLDVAYSLGSPPAVSGCGSVDDGTVTGAATITIGTSIVPMGTAFIAPQSNPVTLTLTLPNACIIATPAPSAGDPDTTTYYADVTGVQGNVVIDYAVN